MNRQENGNSNPYHPSQKLLEARRKKLIERSILFSSIVAVCVSGRIFYVDFIFHHKVTLLEAIRNSIGIFLGVFAFIAAALISGGKSNYRGGENVSPWFAWLIAGSCVVFWIGAFWFGTLYPGGFIAVGAWTFALLAVWAVTLRKKA